MKKQRLTHSLNTTAQFNMIELVLALVVVIIGVIGVIGLLPTGLESNVKAIGSGSAGDAAEQFLRFNASQVNNDWSWTNMFANAKPSGSDEPNSDGWQQSPIFSAGNSAWNTRK